MGYFRPKKIPGICFEPKPDLETPPAWVYHKIPSYPYPERWDFLKELYKFNFNNEKRNPEASGHKKILCFFQNRVKGARQIPRQHIF
jgi:hypothetical protein